LRPLASQLFPYTTLFRSLPYLEIINPLEGLVGAEDQARNKPADMFKPFRTTKDLSKAFHPLGQDLRHPNNRQHGSTFLFLSHPRSEEHTSELQSLAYLVC